MCEKALTTRDMTDAQVKDTILSLLGRVEREGMDRLIDYLENKCDFFTAPASTKYHSAVKGGLARHSLNVFYRLLQLVSNEQKMDGSYMGQNDQLDQSVIIVALLHDICKTNFYVEEMRNKKNENGVWEKVPFFTIKDSLPYGHGEKSVYIVSGFIRLTREEAMAIRWHMGGFDSSMKGGDYTGMRAFEQFPLAALAHIADLQATYLDETRPDR